MRRRKTKEATWQVVPRMVVARKSRFVLSRKAAVAPVASEHFVSIAVIVVNASEHFVVEEVGTAARSTEQREKVRWWW